MAPPLAPPIVFISYRQSDSRHATGRLHTRLVPRNFSEDEVFIDLRGIDRGADIGSEISQDITTCQIVLVIIGQTWLSVADANGRRRLDDPDDFVRREVGSALGRGIPVIPVLIDGAAIPPAAELPEPMRALSLRAAVRLGNDRFEEDVDALAREIKRLIGRPENPGLDLIKLMFSFQGTASRRQFWLGLGLIAAAYLPVMAALAWASGLPVATALFWPQEFAPKQQTILQIGALWSWWPALALMWKRLRDLGQGWGFFAPILALSAVQTGLTVAGMPESTTLSIICLVVLIVVGSVQGTRFVARGAD